MLGPERIKDLYVIQSLVNASTPFSRVVFGSDWYVASANPLDGIFAAVTRISDNYPSGFCPEQRITVEQALKGYTVDAAYAAFKDDQLGMLRSGYFADLAILDRNLFNISATSIRDTKVLMTMVGGQVQHRQL